MDDLPHNIEVEQALIGACLYDVRAAQTAVGLLGPDDFWHPAHADIWRAMQAVDARGAVPTLPLVAAEVRDSGNLREAGGTQYLAHLVSAVVTTSGISHYADQVRDHAARRAIILAAREAIAMAYAPPPGVTAAAIATDHAATLDPIMQGASTRGLLHLSDHLGAAIADWEAATRAGGPVGIMTGLSEVDRYLRGLRAGRLYVVAGRPAMGKTALVLSVMLNAATAGARVGLWSLEMGGADLGQRLLCAEADISAEQADMGRLTPDDFARLLDAKARLSGLGIHIDDNESLSPAQLRARALAHKRKHGLDLILIDYLGLMDSDGGGENRVQEVSSITRALKRLAKQADCPVVLLSQLNRAVEQREDKRPQLSDLRESGSIEQDADAVLFLFREEYYLSRDMPRDGEKGYAEKFTQWQQRLEACRGMAEIIVAKQRRGPVGTARVRFDGPRTRFTDF